MTKATIEQFCQYLVEKYLKGKTFNQVIWADVHARVDRQNLTVAEEQDVREFIAGESRRMVREEAQRRREEFARKKQANAMGNLGVA